MNTRKQRGLCQEDSAANDNEAREHADLSGAGEDTFTSLGDVIGRVVARMNFDDFAH